jgi:hypothetical protein
MEALAGLARLALAGGEPSQAMTHVNEILEHLRAHTLDGTYEPFRIYWTCYRVLKAHHDAHPTPAEFGLEVVPPIEERADGFGHFLPPFPARRGVKHGWSRYFESVENRVPVD